jgi:hypothetical protein
MVEGWKAITFLAVNWFLIGILWGVIIARFIYG